MVQLGERPRHAAPLSEGSGGYPATRAAGDDQHPVYGVLLALHGHLQPEPPPHHLVHHLDLLEVLALRRQRPRQPYARRQRKPKPVSEGYSP